MNQAQVYFVFLLLLGYVAAQYDTYEDEEGEDDREEEAPSPRVDYSKYFSGVGAPTSPGVTPHAVGDSSGFVQPLDFTGLFVGGQFGLDGLAGGASQQVFQTPGSVSVALPSLSSGAFPLHQAQVPSNTSGFVTNNVNFRSLFDTSGSSSEHGFRPQDFLPKESQPQPTSHGSFFSPAFSTLQHDVDREVNYQKKEEAVIEQSKAASRRQPVEDDEDDDSGEYDPSEYEFDDTPILDPNDRSPQKYLKQPYEEEEDYGNPNRKGIKYKTPHSSQQIVYYPRYEARPAESKQRKPLPTLPEPEDDDDDDDEGYGYKGKDYSEGTSYPNKRPPPTKVLYPKYPSQSIPSKPIYDPSSRPNNQYRPQSPSYQPGYPRPSQYPTPYNSAQSKHYPVSSGPRSVYSNPHSRAGTSDFRPSPKDPYIISPDRRSETPQNRPLVYEGPYPLPQTEFATVIPRKPKQPIASASEKNKSCKKIHKKINPNDFARFKREQMTCYVCTNKEKGNTYEECSYESDPKANSYYKGSAEAYSSDTVLTPKTFHVRRRRDVKYSLNEYDDDNIDSEISYKELIRKVRQYDYSSDPDEQGHGPENYRFGPEHFKKNKPNKQNKRSQRRYDYEAEYDEEDEDEEEDETDIEKEYQPPGASDSDDCERVDKNGLSCMVCVNPKTGGSYEQCSYASEPEANRYEYARQSRYGSKKPNSERYKRYTDNTYHKNDSEKSRRAKPNRIHQQRKASKVHREKGDFKENKLKRKKVSKGGYSKKPLAFSGSEAKRTKVKKHPEPEEEMPGVVGLDPYFYGSPEKYDPRDYDEKGRKINKNNKKHADDDETSATSAEEELEDFNPSYDETFFRLFPELEGTDPYTGEKEGGDTDEKEAKEEDDSYPEIPYEEVDDEEESESKQQNNKVKPTFNYGVPIPGYYFDDDESKKDLEKTLDEFVQKNRSDCKKVVKNHMTCYQCLDKKGMQHEECMFVAATEPKSKHLAYHEVKEFRVAPTENTNTTNSGSNKTHIKPDKELKKHPLVEEQMVTRKDSPSYEIYESASKPELKESPREETKTTKINRMRKSKNGQSHERATMPTDPPLMIVPDNEGQPALAYDIKKITPKNVENLSTTTSDDSSLTMVLKRKKRKPESHPIVAESRSEKIEEANNEKENDGDESDQADETPNTRPNYNSIPPDPEGFDEREGPEGAYSHETEPVFDSVLKITLPKYMLMKSEHEAIFDEVFRSG